MKNFVFLSILLLAATPAAFVAQQQSLHVQNSNSQYTHNLALVYTAAKKSLASLQKQAEKGSFDDAIAIGEFYMSVKDPAYEIFQYYSVQTFDRCNLSKINGGLGKVYSVIRDAIQAKENLEESIQCIYGLIYKTIKTCLNTLQQKAEVESSLEHNLALAEFYKSVKDRNYTIEARSSWLILEEKKLLEGDQVMSIIRGAIRANENLDADDQKEVNAVETFPLSLEGDASGSGKKRKKRKRPPVPLFDSNVTETQETTAQESREEEKNESQ